MTDDTTPKKTETANSPSEGAAKSGTAKPDPAKSDAIKPEGSAPSSYSRGEGQKPVTATYKDNWNAIYGKKKKTKTTKTKATKTKAKKTKAAKATRKTKR